MSEHPDYPDVIAPGLHTRSLGQGPAQLTSVDIADLFVAACKTYGDRPAYKIGETWLNYSDCAARVAGIAASLNETLERHVVNTGEQAVIAVLLPNSHTVLECFFVAAVTRSIVFPLNERLSPAELERGIRASGATILLTSDAFAKTLLAIDWFSTKVETVVWTGAAVEVPVSNHLVWGPAQAQDREAQNPHWSRDRPAYLHGFNTSGTTGQVKTILHSSANVVEHSFASINALGLRDDDVNCWAHIGPMFHVGDAVFVWIATLIGARHVFHDNQLQVTNVASLLASERVTMVKLVPTMLQILCGSEALKGLRFPHLKWILTGGAAPDPQLIRKTSEVFGCDFIQGYGMTEATCHIAFKNETRSPSVEGLAVLPILDVTIIDEENRHLDAGMVGEIAIKGPTVFDRQVLDGKFETPTMEFTADGFYRSGDLGFLDTTGKLHIVGRRKDMINVGGENVFAWEVERIVATLPDVQECAAFAMEHELLGEVVELAVVRSSEDLTSDVIKDSCRRQLAGFKVPQRVHFVEKLHRTPTGKLQKHLIREQVKSVLPRAAPTAARARDGAAEAVHQIVSDYMKTLAISNINSDEPLFDAGLDSLGAIDLISQLEEHFGTTVLPTLLYDHPTINGLAAYFGANKQSTIPDVAEAPAANLRRTVDSNSAASRQSSTAPIALLLQTIGIFLRPVVLSLSTLPILILFDLCAHRLSAFELLLTGPGWLALLLANTMLIVVFVSRVLGSFGTDPCELWSPQYFRWLFVHNLFRSLEIPLGVLRGSPLLNELCRNLGDAVIRRRLVLAYQ